MSEKKTFDQYEVDRIISFKANPVQTVTWDPKAVMRDGRFGPEVQVLQDGRTAWLPCKAAGLAVQLKAITEKSKITITRSGVGTSTTYEVKVLGKK